VHAAGKLPPGPGCLTSCARRQWWRAPRTVPARRTTAYGPFRSGSGAQGVVLREWCSRYLTPPLNLARVVRGNCEAA